MLFDLFTHKSDFSKHLWPRIGLGVWYGVGYTETSFFFVVCEFTEILPRNTLQNTYVVLPSRKVVFCFTLGHEFDSRITSSFRNLLLCR